MGSKAGTMRRRRKKEKKLALDHAWPFFPVMGLYKVYKVYKVYKGSAGLLLGAENVNQMTCLFHRSPVWFALGLTASQVPLPSMFKENTT